LEQLAPSDYPYYSDEFFLCLIALALWHITGLLLRMLFMHTNIMPFLMKRGTDPDVHTTGLLLDDTKIFVLFPFELHIGYHVMPWYPTLAYTSFVRLFDKLDVIDRNASIESGAYVSQLSAAAHARAASRKPVSKSDRNSSLESSDSDLLPVMLV